MASRFPIQQGWHSKDDYPRCLVCFASVFVDDMPDESDTKYQWIGRMRVFTKKSALYALGPALLYNLDHVPVDEDSFPAYQGVSTNDLLFTASGVVTPRLCVQKTCLEFKWPNEAGEKQSFEFWGRYDGEGMKYKEFQWVHEACLSMLLDSLRAYGERNGLDGKVSLEALWQCVCEDVFAPDFGNEDHLVPEIPMDQYMRWYEWEETEEWMFEDPLNVEEICEGTEDQPEMQNRARVLRRLEGLVSRIWDIEKDERNVRSTWSLTRKSSFVCFAPLWQSASKIYYATFIQGETRKLICLQCCNTLSGNLCAIKFLFDDGSCDLVGDDSLGELAFECDVRNDEIMECVLLLKGIWKSKDTPEYISGMKIILRSGRILPIFGTWNGDHFRYLKPIEGNILTGFRFSLHAEIGISELRIYEANPNGSFPSTKKECDELWSKSPVITRLDWPLEMEEENIIVQKGIAADLQLHWPITAGILIFKLEDPVIGVGKYIYETPDSWPGIPTTAWPLAFDFFLTSERTQELDLRSKENPRPLDNELYTEMDIDIKSGEYLIGIEVMYFVENSHSTNGYRKDVLRWHTNTGSAMINDISFVTSKDIKSESTANDHLKKEWINRFMLELPTEDDRMGGFYFYRRPGEYDNVYGCTRTYFGLLARTT